MAKDDAVGGAALDASALATRMRARRAIEAAVRGLPLVAFEALARAFERDAGGAFNQVLLWSRPGDWRNQAPAADPEALCLAAFFETREAGPVVLEIPPADDGSIEGTIVDGRLRALGAIGPRGLDRGEGARMLVLPPGFRGDAPTDCIVLPATSGRGAALLHSVPRGPGEADRVRAASHLKRLRLYPLAAVGRPPPTRFVEAADILVDARPPFDVRLFEILARALAADPWPLQERAIEESFAPVGIARGQVFAPDAPTAALLEDAACEARAWLHAVDEASRQPCGHDSHWAPWIVGERGAPSAGATTALLVATPADHEAVAALRAAAWQRSDDTACLIATRDRRGELLDGGQAYRLHLPAHVPAARGWSVAAYDAQTHALLREVPHAGRSSRTPGAPPGTDGAIDLFFGPAPPAGRQAAWIPTCPGIGWEAILRLRGAGPEWRAGGWMPGDLEPR